MNEQALFETGEDDARLTSIPLAHAIPGTSRNLAVVVRASNRRAHQIEDGQTELGTAPEPRQIDMFAEESN